MQPKKPVEKIIENKIESPNEENMEEEEEVTSVPVMPQSFPKINKNHSREVPSEYPAGLQEEVLVDNRPIRPAKNMDFGLEENPEKPQEEEEIPEEKKEVKKKPFLKRKKKYDPLEAIKKTQPTRPKTPL